MNFFDQHLVTQKDNLLARKKKITAIDFIAIRFFSDRRFLLIGIILFIRFTTTGLFFLKKTNEAFKIFASVGFNLIRFI